MLGFSGTREWVYPQSISGRFTTLRRWTFLSLHLILFVTPWITVDDHPLLLIDIPARRVFLLGGIYTASDTFFLLLLMLFLAFALFFFTALWGRLWCGYACPQTVFLETWIRPLEIWIEGDRTQRKRRDRLGWSFDRIWRKAAKWAAFLAVAFLLAMAIVSFFVPARELWTLRAKPAGLQLRRSLHLPVVLGLHLVQGTVLQFSLPLCPFPECTDRRRDPPHRLRSKARRAEGWEEGGGGRTVYRL